MTSREIEARLIELIEDLNKNEFVYDFLLAFGFSKTSITRLKKGDFNRSDQPEEILYKGKLFFKESETSRLMADIDFFAGEERILKQNPRFIIVTDFISIAAKDLRTGVSKEFSIGELPDYVPFFLPLTGAEIYKSSNDNKADREASYALARLYDIIIQENKELYANNSHSLNVLLARVLFCYFAEDTGIFPRESMFTDTLANHTKTDGSDMQQFFTELFHKLNTNKGLFPSYIRDFPYVNGGLFKDDIAIPVFSKKSRDILLSNGELKWDEINPDIFGSMIQAVAEPSERGNLGMHYTSVPNILKLIRPLFLDELYDEFEKQKDNYNALKRLIFRMSRIKFFDPACGSGNFLIITYKELRALEIKIIHRLIELDAERGEIIFYYSSIQLSQLYGIEIKDFAHEMAQLSLWLAEHQMNKVFEDELLDYGRIEPILPLKDAGHIVCANATRIDWNDICPILSSDDEVYVIGNPPYLGSRTQGKEQKNDMEFVFRKSYKSMDYVSIWFYKGAKYIESHNAQLAFVSTNSVCQGLLVALTWKRILNENIEISFAYQSFKWTNNAKGNAGVTVIIVGLRNKNNNPKYIYTEGIKKEAKNINAYLLDAPNSYIEAQNKPISNFPTMNFGNMPADGGHLLFTEDEKEEFIADEPKAKHWVKTLISAHEFLNGKNRYCIWLENITKQELEAMPLVKERVDLVYNERIKSSRPHLAKIPHLFAQITQPKDSDFILIPRHSSEDREYIPIGFFSSDTIASDSTLIIGTSQPWLFGVLHSKMHMVWVDAVGGKLKTDYRYSAKLCYNTFPFPEIDVKQKTLLGQYVKSVFDERAKFSHKTMAWLYNPETMPQGLKQAHHELDLAVEQIYRLRPFTSDAERLEFLFKRYEEMLRENTLFMKVKKRRKRT